MADKGCKEWLAKWLNDAYAMEEGIINTLENHVEQAEARPDLQSAIRAHIDHTRSQSERVQRAIEMLGEKPSTMKRMGMEMMASLQSTGMGAAEDRLIKNILAEYSTEHFEIASYRAIAEAAKYCGNQEVANLCREIVQEEEMMAETLSRNLESAVSDFIRQSAGEPIGTKTTARM